MKMQSFPQDTDHATNGMAAGLAAFVAAAASEAFGAVPAEQVMSFYRAVGGRLAGFETLEGVHDVAGLSMRVNTFWQQLGWGEADFAVGEDAITVRHRGGLLALPVPAVALSSHGDEVAQQWRAVMEATLEGAYDTWFRMLGSGPTLRTVASWKSDILELRHGR